MLDVAAFLLVLTALLAVLNQRVLRLPPTIGLMAMALLLSHLFWELVDELLNAVLFVMVGLQVITLRMPGGLAPALAAFATAIVVALAARWIAVGLPVRLFPARSACRPGRRWCSPGAGCEAASRSRWRCRFPPARTARR